MTTMTAPLPDLLTTIPVGWGEPPLPDGDTPLFDIADLVEPDDEDWQERGLCAQTDPDAFFPEKGGSTRDAKRICLGCDVRDECLEYALDHNERFGIWGGLSERERRKLQPRPTPPGRRLPPEVLASMYELFGLGMATADVVARVDASQRTVERHRKAFDAHRHSKTRT